MLYLISVSIIWALSFSLIKGSLTNIDSNFVAFIRLLISLIVFLPFFRFKKIKKNLIVHFLFLGGVQYGFMYITYIYAYQFLKAYEIAILTIFTPLFVVLFYDLLNKKFILFHWIKAILAVLGAGIIVFSESTTIGFWKGIILIQLSNLFFAFGQVYYKKLLEKNLLTDQRSNYSIIYIGAVIVTGLVSVITTDFINLNVTPTQWTILIYLGAIASGLCFFLWNFGATKVEPGTLAVLNNLKIPLGVVFAIMILGESSNYIQLILGFLIILIALYTEQIITKLNITKLN